MIDLIIPYYNNKNGLVTTLQSILFPDMFYITVVDDCSTEYPLIFPLRADQVLRYNINHGPGYARQFGLERTHNEWVMFIDTGDIFLTRSSFDHITYAIEHNPEADIISFPYLYKDDILNETSNRMHGKIYKRAFLEKYNITFPLEASYMNEDIGFNRACKLCTSNIIYQHLPIIKWMENENSLTEKENNAALYRDQNRALSLASIHAINICLQNNVKVEEEINQIAIALYYWFVRAAAERPEYIQEAWSGAKIFYDKFKDQIIPNNLMLGNPKIKQCLTYRNKINFPINILRFAHDIQQYEEIPKNYLGGD